MQLVTLGAFALENTAMRRARPLLLLTYVRLAGPVPRARLARLLWPHAIDERNSLREALHALRTIDPNLIIETPAGLVSEVACDAAELLEAAKAGDDRRVAALHGGPFLGSVPLVAVGSEFEDWVLATGERIARAARVAHLRLARHALDAGDAIGALGEARAALGSEPWDDPSDLETATLGALAAALPACLRDHLSGLSCRSPQVTVPLPGVIGRAREATAALEALAEPGAWLQVVGLPGVGKSTLGRLVLHHLRAPRPHLDTRSVLITARQPSARDLLGCIAAALGLESSASVSMPAGMSAERQVATWLFLKYYTSTDIQARWARASNYSPVRASVAAGLGDYFEADPAYQVAFDLLQYGVAEPPVPGYDFDLAEAVLAEHGFECYEVSNHARPGHRSRHNPVYWRGQAYLALGPAAAGLLPAAHGDAPGAGHSLDAANPGRSGDPPDAVADRTQNPPIKAWLRGDPPERTPVDGHAFALEKLMTGLRTVEGVDVDELRATTGIDVATIFPGALATALQHGLLALEATRLRATRAGIRVLNAVLRGFFGEGCPPRS